VCWVAGQASDVRLLMLANRVGVLSELDRRAEAIDFFFGQWDEALAEIDPAVGLPGPDYLPMLVDGLAALMAAHRQDWQTAEDYLSELPDRQVFGFASGANVHYVLLAGGSAAGGRRNGTAREVRDG
jgi:hypothetical protein